MIYKGIIFKADPFSYNLEFDDRITLVGGDSGTGRTFLYGLLKDIRLTEEYNAIKLFNYKSDDFLEAIKQSGNKTKNPKKSVISRLSGLHSRVLIRF